MLNRIIPALALGIFAITTPACADIDTLTRADRSRAEAARLSAQASAHDAEARLTSAQAMSVTLATTSRHAERMTTEALSRADRLAALGVVAGLSAGALAGLLVTLLLVLKSDRLRADRRDDAALREIAARLRMLECGTAALSGQLRALPPERRAQVRALIADPQKQPHQNARA